MRHDLIAQREKRNLTQKQVAKSLGISERNYQRYESGESKGDIEFWVKLSELLGVDILQIYRNT